jgi:putative SOS response-associated peptidase YedK
MIAGELSRVCFPSSRIFARNRVPERYSMCGRYSLTRREAEIEERFGIEQLLMDRADFKPRYNIAPTQLVPVIVDQDGQRVLAEMKWGLIPFWAKDIKKTKPIINARSESIAEKPFFKQAANKRRCLIPADGFFEWKKVNKDKIPMFIHMDERELFAFAGLWDEWKSPDGEQILRTCTIITTEANGKITPLHDRMPVIVRPEHEARWLDPSIKDIEKLRDVLEQLPDNALDMYQVSQEVNSYKKDEPSLLEPAPAQQNLFG